MKSTKNASYLTADFQIFKGRCERTMQSFGIPCSAQHEAQLIIEDDQRRNAGRGPAIYAIYQRSEHRIIQIIGSEEGESVELAA